MMEINGKTMDQERALYGAVDTRVSGCRFDGPADGESALKECRNVTVEDTFFNLRYPMWHDSGLNLVNCELTDKCRAALWYTDHAEILDSRLHGIKALRECREVGLTGCDIVSPEFGWSSRFVSLTRCTAQSEYFFLRGEHLKFENVEFTGKYSFQYVRDAEFRNCVLNTKDAFWHSENVTVYDSVVAGEYLAWYSDHLTLVRCKISGTQPLCYCKNLTLIDCEMEGADFAFEKSEVQARITTPVISIKNPLRGCIEVPSVGEIIRDDSASAGEIIVGGEKK